VKNYTFTITEAELAVLSEALGEMPFKKVALLTANMQKQINEQQKSLDDNSIPNN
jgi:hypothetical protein